MTSISNRSIPAGTFIPALSYAQNVGTVIDWLVGAFGVTERFRAGDSHGQIAFGNGGCLISGQRSDLVIGNAQHLTIQVPNVDLIYERAKAFGAEIVSEPQEFMYGERQFVARDLGGHLWNFSQSLHDVDPVSWGGIMPE